MIERVNRHRR